MPAGLQTFYANGSPQLTLTDRLTKSVQSGSLGVMQVNQTKTVNIPGIKDDGNWFAVATELTITKIFNGYITVERTDYYGFAPNPHNWEVFYTVFRL